VFELVEPEEFCIYMSSPWEKFKPGNWRQGWIQHDLVGVGGGGCALPALVQSCVGHVRHPPINIQQYLLHYCS
jgi:hypothetical protein